MSCARATEIDLHEFLAGPRDPRWAEFLAHYPGCDTCAAEVRTWAEIEGLLRPADSSHPDPETLRRYETSPSDLSVAERSRIEAHLTACETCVDELRTYRSFDFKRLHASSTAAHRAHSRSSTRRIVFAILTSVRRTFLHPALAYALLVLVLLPQLIQRLERRAAPIDGDSARFRGSASDTSYWQTIQLAAPRPEGTTARVTVSPTADGVRFIVPVPEPFRIASTITVAIQSPDQSREIREHRASAAEVVVDLPRWWFSPGVWHVVLESGNEKAEVSLEMRFSGFDE